MRTLSIPFSHITFVLVLAAGCSGEEATGKATTGGFGMLTYSRTLQTQNSGSVTYNHIFSAVADPSVEGEGFFADFGEGTVIFVASHFTDNPHDIANTQRKFQAILKGVNKVTYAATEPLDVFVESKENLGAEHRLLTPAEYEALADQVRELGKTASIHLVYYKDLQFEFDTVRFPCKNVESFAETTMTTGGSVYFFTVRFSDETDDLNLVAATAEPDSLDLLAKARAEIEACKGGDQAIVATQLAFQDEIFTLDGVRSGWTAFVSQIRVE